MFVYSPSSRPDESGLAVVTDRFVCLAGRELSRADAAALYGELEREDTGIAEAIDFLVVQCRTSRFALVEVVDPRDRRMRVAVSGNVLVDIRGEASTTLSGQNGGTWLDSEVDGVSSIRLALGADATEGHGLPIRRGVVEAARIDFGAPSAARPVQRAKAPETSPISLPWVEDPHPAIPAPVETSSPRAVSGVGWVLRLPDGNLLEPARPLLLGRRPWSHVDDTGSALHVAAPSPRREISALHLEVALVDNALVARDLDSTNGTLLLSPGRPPRLLHAGAALPVSAGDVLDLGEGFRVEVRQHD